MKKSLEQSKSIWMDTGQVPKETSLTEKKRGDVCVVGAGIAGMTTAYLLAREGKSVVVLDDGPIAGGQTRRTTAHLSHALEHRYYQLERIQGEEGICLTSASQAQAIDSIVSSQHV